MVFLTRGGVAIIDEADYEMVRRMRWYLHSNGYAVSKTGRVQTYMHRLILGVPQGVNVDHINGDPRDNRRSNLRPCNQSQNNGNMRGQRNASSRFKGVSLHKDTGKWSASIGIGNGRSRHLGLFAQEEEAARAYDAAAIALFGEFARPNFTDARVAELLERTQVVATARRRESREVLVAKEAEQDGGRTGTG